MRRTLTTAAAAAALVLASATGASAAPPERETFTLDCDDGHVYEVVVSGNGTFTPGRIVGGGGVIVPTSLGDFTFTATFPDGTVVTEHDAGFDHKGKGNVEARNPRVDLTCTVSATFVVPVADDEFPAGTVLSFTGTVTGFLAGRG